MSRIGVIVNPIAGMGGRVGLKGTDGKVEEARALGAEPWSPDRAVEALTALRQRAPDAEIVTCGPPMGAEEAERAGFDPTIVYEPSDSATTDDDTRAAVRALVESDVELILFAGGDGTATDVAETLDDLGADVPILGIPAGVKIFSSVFAVTPRTAGRIAADFDAVERREVNDIDEEAYREGTVRSTLKAVVNVPVAEEVQSGKQLAGGRVEALVAGFVDDVRPGVTYVFGPGGTVGAIESALGIDGSPLGVDVWRDGELLVKDGSEGEILAALGEENVIVVSPIGGQGFIFGRGNAQLSPAVIGRCSIEVVAAPSKLDTVGVLRVDTGDPETDEALRGWMRVRTGRYEYRMLQVK